MWSLGVASPEWIRAFAQPPVAVISCRDPHVASVRPSLLVTPPLRKRERKVQADYDVALDAPHVIDDLVALTAIAETGQPPIHRLREPDELGCVLLLAGPVDGDHA